jgi:PAS domain S-box-containing protein
VTNDPADTGKVDRFFALSIDMLCIIGFDCVIQQVNPAMEETLGQPAADLVGRPLVALIHPVDRSLVAASLQPDDGAERFEARVETAHGDYRWVEWSARPDPAAGIFYVVGRDNTERRRHEANLAFLADVQDDLARLTSAEGLMQAVGAKIGYFLHVPFSFLATIDEERDEVTVNYVWRSADAPNLPHTVSLSTFLTPAFNERARAGKTVVVRDTSTDPIAIAEHYVGLNVRSFITVPFRKDGAWIYQLAICDSQPRDWRDDEVELFEELANRVIPRIEHARAEAAVRASEERLRKATSIDTIGVVFFTLDGHITNANAAFERMTGYSVAELRNLTHWASLTPPEFLEATEHAVSQLATRGETAPYEKQFIRKDGTHWWGLFAPTRLSGTGRQSACVEFVVDITERTRTDAALRESEERQAFLLQLSDTLRPLADAGSIQAEATRVLGEWLEVNRVIYIDIDELAERFVVKREHHVPSARSVVGRYQYENVNPALLEGLRAGQTLVVPDIDSAPLLSEAKRAAYRRIGTVAFVAVPLVKDVRLVSLLSVQSSVPRAWRAVDVPSIEEAAERTWAAVTRARSEQALRESEERYRTLFETIDEGFLTGEAIEDEHGRVVDYRILEINPAYQEMSGVSQDKLIGKRVREIMPDLEPFWFETIDTVITERTDIRLERFVPELGTWFECYVAPAGEEDGRRFVAVFTNVTKRKQVEEERERARQEAEAAVHARDEFLSIASHELRNPVAAIKATAQLLRRLHRRMRLDERRLDRYTRTLVETSDRLAMLVDDLLDVSRMQSGQLSVQTEPIDLAALVQRAVEIERIASQGHRLRLHIEEGRTLMLDPERIQQVIVNLLDNAIKYSPGGGEVRILLSYQADGAELRIEDQGIGLPVQALESIFEPFGRAANATRSQIQGMGLGLAIARRIAEAHGGRLWAESEGEGRGTTMRLWLPGVDDPV